MENNMTQKEFKKIAQLLKKVYQELEFEALKNGVNITGEEYDLMVANAREAVLKKFGFTIEEYRTAKEEAENLRRGERPSFEELKTVVEEYRKLPVLTKEEVAEIATDVAKKYVTAPQIINKIVKEIKIQTPPQIIKETIVNEITQRVEYDDTQLQKELKRILQQIDEIKVAEPLDIPKLKEELHSDFSVFFDKNIDILGMPNFRKLAMGLRADIDRIDNEPGGAGSGTVTEVSSANGALSVATGTTTPVLTVNSAPILTTARTIGGTSFDGSANITVATATGGFTVSGGNLVIGTNSITLTGSIAATGSRVTKVWTTDIESTNMPTVGGTSLSSTFLALSGGTLTGSITFGESTALVYDPTLSADGTYCGTVEIGTGGTTIAVGDVIYFAVADSRWELADSSAASTSGDVKVGLAVTTSTDGNPVTILLEGKLRADAVFPAFTVGAPIWISETAGDLTNTAPVTTDSVSRRMGFGQDNNTIWFTPSNDYITHT